MRKEVGQAITSGQTHLALTLVEDRFPGVLSQVGGIAPLYICCQCFVDKVWKYRQVLHNLAKRPLHLVLHTSNICAQIPEGMQHVTRNSNAQSTACCLCNGEQQTLSDMTMRPASSAGKSCSNTAELDICNLWGIFQTETMLASTSARRGISHAYAMRDVHACDITIVDFL